MAWGGPDALHNYHIAVPLQRYAYDFTFWQDGSTCQGDCTSNADYHVFGQPVLDPAGGTVVVAVGDQPDQHPGHVMPAIDPGNYLIVDMGDGLYLCIARLQQGSLQIAAGDQVAPGQVLGRAGNSGRSSEPHVNIHLQDSPRFTLSAAR